MRASAGSLLLGIFAVMFGLLGAYVVRKELHKPNYVAVAGDNKPGTQTVPVASVTLEPGRKIEFGDIAIVKLTPAQMKAQKITGAFMTNTKQIIGRVLKTEIKEGQPFDTPDFYPEGTGPSVAERLKKGYRAVTVSVDQDSAVAGFAIPGSIVDVMFRADSKKDTDPKAREDELPELTVTLIEAAEVLALNHDTAQVLRTADPKAPMSSAKASVTLAVTPKQAASLRVVDGRGTMSLALRNKDDLDVGPEEFSPRTLDDLLERSNNKHKMEIYRGRQMSQTSFKNNERLTPTSPGVIASDPIPANVPIPQTAHNAPNVIIVNPRNAAFGGVND
jgi:pilus assembly protein CpaB